MAVGGSFISISSDTFSEWLGKKAHERLIKIHDSIKSFKTCDKFSHHAEFFSVNSGF